MNDKISIFDPTVQAYREVSIEDARRFVESAKEAEAKLAELETNQ